MPTISFPKQDLTQLIGRECTLDELEEWMLLVKGEIKEYETDTDTLKVEVTDTNRPDLWCAEGIARQIRMKVDKRPRLYSFSPAKNQKYDQIIVGPTVKAIRPFVCAFKALGNPLTDNGLTQLIQTQEKLADMFGQKRRSASIGIYRLDHIRFPVMYDLADPARTRFIPLGFPDAVTLSDILEAHPKGIEYRFTLIDTQGHRQYPLLTDAAGTVLSFPPIINSREIGEVRVGDRNLFVEATGTNLRSLLHVINILAANLADRGATIEPIEVVYPEPTEFGKTVYTPVDVSPRMSVGNDQIASVLGKGLSLDEGKQALIEYGYRVTHDGQILSVKQPVYRNDAMHPVDVIEDIAISRGYKTFETTLPSDFTVGNLSESEAFSDTIRGLMIGFGFQETLSNILASRDELVSRMNLQNADLIEVENVMSLTYSCVRQWMIPSLLRVETASSHSFYPHRVFEVGEVVNHDPQSESGTVTRLVLGALLAHPSANFSEMHSYVDLLFYSLSRAYTVEPVHHPSFIDGRVGQLLVDGHSCGMLGEIHPQVLNNWQIAMPCAVFELSLDVFMNPLPQARPAGPSIRSSWR